jgi:hypothetical protein
VIFSAPIVFTLLSRGLIHNQRWSEAKHLFKWMTTLAWLGLLLFYGSIIVFYGLAYGFDTTVIGWTNRFMVAAYRCFAYDNSGRLSINRIYSHV